MAKDKKKEKMAKPLINIIKIEQTKDFWIDSGILGLYFKLNELNTKILANKYKLPSFKAYIDEIGTSLYIEAKNGDEITKIMNTARKLAINELVEETDNDGLIYNSKEAKFFIEKKQNWIYAFKNFYKGNHGQGKKIILNNETKNFINKYEIFVNNNPGVKNANIFLDQKPKYEIGEEFDISFIESGNRICYISNKYFKKVTNTKTYNYPFIAGSGGINYFSELKGNNKISSLYSFVSIFSPLNVFYTRSEDTVCVFLLQDFDLNSLRIWIESVKGYMVVSKNKHCNFRKPIILKKDDSSKQISNKYLYDSLLIFIYSIYLFTYKELKRDFKKQLLTKSIVSFVSEGEIYQNIKIFSKLEPLFDLFEKLRSNTSNPQQDLFIEMINSFYDKNSNNLTWKNELSKLILDFRTIVALLEEYYGAICMRDNYVHYFLITFLEIYMKELNIMKVEIVEKCKTMGNLIGNLCFVKNDKGILYSLRNTRNRIDFLKLLSDIQFRLEITYSEQFFLDLPDEPEWIETKSLITIFAMNSFLYKQNKKGELNHG